MIITGSYVYGFFVCVWLKTNVICFTTSFPKTVLWLCWDIFYSYSRQRTDYWGESFPLDNLWILLFKSVNKEMSGLAFEMTGVPNLLSSTLAAANLHVYLDGHGCHTLILKPKISAASSFKRWWQWSDLLH